MVHIFNNLYFYFFLNCSQSIVCDTKKKFWSDFDLCLFEQPTGQANHYIIVQHIRGCQLDNSGPQAQLYKFNVPTVIWASNHTFLPLCTSNSQNLGQFGIQNRLIDTSLYFIASYEGNIVSSNYVGQFQRTCPKVKGRHHHKFEKGS